MAVPLSYVLEVVSGGWAEPVVDLGVSADRCVDERINALTLV